MDEVTLLVGGGYLLAFVFCLISLFTPGWYWTNQVAQYGLIQYCFLGKCQIRTAWSSYEIGVLSLVCFAAAIMIISLTLFVFGVVKQRIRTAELSGAFMMFSGLLCSVAFIVFVVYFEDSIPYEKAYGYSFVFCLAAGVFAFLSSKFGLNLERWQNSNPFQNLP